MAGYTVKTGSRIANPGVWGTRAVQVPSTGEWYAFVQDTTSGAISACPLGATSTTPVTTNQPTNNAATAPFDVDVEGNFCYVAYFTAANTLNVRRFDHTSDTWESSDFTTGLSTNSPSQSFPIQITVRSTGIMLASFAGTTLAAYLARSNSASSGGGWQAPVNMLSSAWPAGMVTTPADTTYLFMMDSAQDDFTHRSYSSANVAGTVTDFDTTTPLNDVDKLKTAQSTLYNDGTNDKVVVPVIDSTGEIDLWTGIIGSGNLSSTAVLAGISTSTTVKTTNISTQVFGSQLYVFWAEANTIKFDVSDDLATPAFGSDQTLLASLTDTDPCPTVFGDVNVLGVLYQDGGDVKLEWHTAPAGGTVPKDVTDTQALASSDAMTLSVAGSQVDTQALSSTDSLTSTVNAPVSDAQALGATEARALAVQATLADTQALGSSESVSLSILEQKGVTDTQALGSSDAVTVALLEQKGVTDSQALASSDLVSLSILEQKAVTDSQALASSDAIGLLALGQATDTQGLGSTTVLGLTAAIAAGDSQAITSTETLGQLVTLTSGDSQGLIGVTTAQVAAQLGVVDSQGLAWVDLVDQEDATSAPPTTKLDYESRMTHALHLTGVMEPALTFDLDLARATDMGLEED